MLIKNLNPVLAIVLEDVWTDNPEIRVLHADNKKLRIAWDNGPDETTVQTWELLDDGILRVMTTEMTASSTNTYTTWGN